MTLVIICSLSELRGGCRPHVFLSTDLGKDNLINHMLKVLVNCTETGLFKVPAVTLTCGQEEAGIIHLPLIPRLLVVSLDQMSSRCPFLKRLVLMAGGDSLSITSRLTNKTRGVVCVELHEITVSAFCFRGVVLEYLELEERLLLCLREFMVFLCVSMLLIWWLINRQTVN